MRLIRTLAFALVAALAWPSTPVPAQGAFQLPGLQRDASNYLGEMRRRFPAGGSPQQRAQAEQKAQQAERTRDWAGAAAAWEERIGLGQFNAEHWLALARAQLQRTPPEATRALQAGWYAFTLAGAGAPEVPALIVMAEALRRLDRPVPMIEALEAVVERMPEEARYRDQLAAARRAAGMLLRGVQTEADAEPARACLSFTVAPARRTDWQPGDWIRADPPIPGLAVEREEDKLCVSGLPWGRSTRLILRAGLPGEDRMALRADTPVTIAVPNRAARIAFDTRSFILPRGQEAQVSVATVNINTLHLRLMRVTERNLVPLRRNWTPGEAMEFWSADNLTEETGRLVWEGRAEVPRFEANRTQRTALPLPEALRGFGPGLFVLVARQGDGGSGGEDRAVAALPIIATDLGLVAWRGADGLAVQVRGLGDARPRAGVRVALMARNNDILAEANTDDTGLARFGAALLRGRAGLAPAAVHAEVGDDLAALSLEAASFDLSDRGATGRAHPGPLDAFLWLDRGIYRPGETVNVAALLRDGGGMPAEVPVRLRVRRPNGQVFAEAVPARSGGAALHWPVRLSANAQFGAWTIEALTDPDAPPIGSAQFRVDAFVPARLDVQIGTVPPQLIPGRAFEVPVTARFLYGAPGAGLTGNAELRLRPDPEPFEAWRGWRFGVATETFEPDLQTFELGETDEQGRATLSITLPQAPDTTRPLRANIAVSVAEPGGRESRARFEVPVRARGNLIAVRPAFEGDAINEGAEATFDIAALNPEGAAVAATLRVRLVRERPNWRIVTRGAIARYETVWRDEPVDAQEIRVTPGQPIRFARALRFGRYRLEVTDANGLGITSIRFRSGWAGVESAEVPDRVDVAADRRAYAPGETARIRIQPPFGGLASIAVMTDRLVSLREVTLPADGMEVEVPVEAAWGPGAYVAVTVFRPGEARQGHPGRALGLAWLGLDPAARQLAVTIEAPERIRPRQRLEVPVRIAGIGAGGTARLTLAAVDEGVLRLTGFVSPDPVPHYTGRRRLGLDIRDDYGRLIPPAEGELTALRQGGDEAGVPPGFQPPQRVVSLFSGIVEAGPDGRAVIALDIPDFAGELRLMAVAWEANRIGAASRPMTVRDEVVAEALLPRFLAPGDEARLPVLLHNVELPAGEVAATLTTEGPIAIAGPTRLAAQLATGARAQPVTAIRATGSGEGVIRLAVTGPNGFRVERESRITIRSSRSPTTEIAAAEIAPGGERAMSPPVARFVPGTWRATAAFGAAVRYDPAALLRAVEFFPLSCTEQVGSRALALSAAMDETSGEARIERLQRAVDAMLDRQRFDGAFGLWSAQGEAQQWLTPFAVEALLRARAAGASVPEGAMRLALREVVEAVEDAGEDTPDGRAIQAYRLHALALAGRVRLGAARRLMERLNDMPTQLSRAQLGSVFARGGDRVRAEQAFGAALEATGRRYWSLDYGTAARDSLATALLLRESGLLPERLTQFMARLPGPELRPQTTSTQEQGWAVAAAVALGQNLRAVRVELGGRTIEARGVALAALAGDATARNLGDATLYSTVSVSGVPVEPLPPERAGMRIRRLFFTTDGQPLDLSRVRQGDSFILLIEAQAETNETHQAMIQQGLPAGWEIADRMGPGDVPNMQWLGTLTETEAQPAMDDRYAAAVQLTGGRNFSRLAVRLRAVTAGQFELPGGEVADMYRPAIQARQATVRVAVLPNE